MWYDIDYRFNLFNTALGLTWCIANDCLAPDANNAPREPAQRVHETHGLGKTWGFTFNDLAGTFGCLVTRRETSAARADDDPSKIVRHANQGLRDIVDAISGEPTLDNDESVPFKCLGQLRTRKIFSGAIHDAVAHGENLGEDW